jgi:type VI secretion system secreted protein Hcp
MKIVTKVLLILLVCYFAAAANGASFEVLLRIEGIQTEINAVSFNMGVVLEGGDPVGGGGALGKPNFTPLTVFKFIDETSPQLFVAAAMGEHFRSATLVVRKSGPNPFTFYRIVLNDVLISSVKDNASATDQNGNLLEQITLKYGRICWTFIPQNADGSPGSSFTRCFDLRSQRGF